MSKRRAKGEGSIFKRADGRWVAKIQTEEGTITKYAKTQSEALAIMKAIQSELTTGAYNAPQKVTLEQWLNTYLADYTLNLTNSARIKYKQDFKNHVIPALGRVKLTSITPTHIQNLVKSLYAEKGLSPKSIKNIHGALHTALQQAVDIGIIKTNPSDRTKLPKQQRKEMQPLDAPEISALLAVLPDSPYESQIRFALFTGMREGEILGLQWDCVNFEAGTITIDKQLSLPREKGAGYHLTLPKHGKTRTIHPAPSVMDLLRRRKREQAADRLRMGALWDPDGFPDLVFTSSTGKHQTAQSLLRYFQKALDAAGLEKRRFHDLRHTYAVASLKAGDDIKTLSENLGHFSVAFTLDRYGHVTDSMKSASASRMEAFIKGL